MSIFDVLKDLIQTKSGKLSEDPSYFEACGSNYILQRWLSMTNSNTAQILQETTNKLWVGLDDDKELWYKLLSMLIPKDQFHKPSYIKKPKKIVNAEKEKIVELIASNQEISQREVVTYLELFDIDLGKYQKAVKL